MPATLITSIGSGSVALTSRSHGSQAGGTDECDAAMPSTFLNRVAARQGPRACGLPGPRGDLEEGLRLDRVELPQPCQPGRHPLDEAPLPDRLGVDVAQRPEQLGPLPDEPARRAGEQRLV